MLSFAKRGSDELYDLKNDPDCLHNLGGNPREAATVERLQSELFKELKEQGDPRMFGQGEIFDQYPQWQCARAPFFYELRYMSGKIKGNELGQLQ